MISVSAIFRILIVWLALLAVPFQGFASAAMLPHVPAPAPATAMHQHHGSHAMASHGAHQCAAHADHSCTPEHHQHGGKCGACCLGVAIVPPPIAPVAPPVAAVTRVLVDSGCPPSAELEFPDRPPRSLHA
jgi:hypothetical protein